MLVSFDNFKCFLVVILYVFQLIHDHHFQSLVLQLIQVLLAPIHRQIRVSCNLEIWVPKTFFAESHLVGNEENENEVVTVVSVVVLINNVVVNFSN